ncbi:hypothetical protein PENTCL1PPCAC_6324 [Pristionchus entomophagus]|uniref:B-related factor 1 n=1 Tax=Pristionchus entomophagus TaxID=358040 RepID=A0AAV5SS28_9BILA|nr:hypothetical protein PENTCL1PPCAC_6324 [Pristionchus entomophagus]
MVRVCPHCGCSDIDEDAGRGDATCTGCGTVIEESIVVSDNQFQERTGGSGHTLVGQTISMDRAHVAIQGVPGLASQESREVTYAKGKKLIEEVASQLRVNKHCVDTAYNFFKMCVTRNLTRGRLRTHVVAACLYMTCRLENTSHLLLDFSDVTQVNVYELGRTLNFLARSLRINLPTTDPCLYILRFSVFLDFGDKQKEVVTLATRLVQRMKKDWLATGRRPTGLCGAALLLAARSYNFNRSVADVVKVVHVSEAVVRKRLDEFSQTPSSALTLDQFSSVDLEHSEDPPAYREARRKAIVAREEEEAERMERDIQPIQEEVEKALEKKQREKFKKSPYARMVGGSIEGDEMGRAEKALITDDILDTVFRESQTHAVEDVYRDAVVGPSLESLGILRGAVAPPPAVSYALPAQDTENGDLFTEDIDDDEINSYILTDQESHVKEKFWMKCNGEHLEEVARRKKIREEEEAKEGEEGKKKRKRNMKKKDNTEAATPAEAIEKIIQEKKLSNKVNYDILKEFSGGDERVERGMGMEEDKKNVFKMEIVKTEREISVFKTPALPIRSPSSVSSTPCTPSTTDTSTPSTPSLPSIPSMGVKRKRAQTRPVIALSKDMTKLSKALDLAPRPGTEDPSLQENIAKKSRLSVSPKKSNGTVENIGEREGEKRKEEKVIENGGEEKTIEKKEDEKRVSTTRRSKINHVPVGVIKKEVVKSSPTKKEVEKEKMEKILEDGKKGEDKGEPSRLDAPSTSVAREESIDKGETSTGEGEEKGDARVSGEGEKKGSGEVE